MKAVKSNTQLVKQEEALKKVFASNDEEKTIKAIKKLRNDGHPNFIPLLLDVLSATENDAVFNAIINLLNDLKDQDAAAPLIEALNNEKYDAIKVFILQVFWQSRLNARPYLDEIVNIAIRSDYMVCLECLTIIESLKEIPSDEEIMAANTILKDAVADSKENRDLLLGIMDTLSNYMIG